MKLSVLALCAGSILMAAPASADRRGSWGGDSPAAKPGRHSLAVRKPSPPKLEPAIPAPVLVPVPPPLLDSGAGLPAGKETSGTALDEAIMETHTLSPLVEIPSSSPEEN